MRTFNILLLACILTGSLTAQEIKFGKISREELKEKSCSTDPDANAAILYKHRETYIQETNGNVESITEIHKRIKIYNKEGFDYATQYINLFKSGSLEEKVSGIKASTYNLEGDKIVETELDKKQIFETELSYNYNQTKFTLPNVKEGSVIEIKYKLRSPYFYSIDDITFQYDIPVKKIYVEIRTPEGYNYKQTSKGFIPFYPKTSVKRDNRLGMNVNIYEYDLENVPALKEENFVDNMDNYRAGTSYELASVSFPGYSKSYAQTWNDVAKTIGNESDYKNELDKTNSFDDEIDALLTGKTTAEDKMNAILDYVKQNITWNNLDGKYFFKGIRKTLKEKTGNAADINLTLVAMLRYAGLDANPVVLSTKDNAIPFFPTLKKLNHVIAYVENEGKSYFMDATDEFSEINILPVKDYNWQGIYINNPKKVWKLIDIQQPEIATSNVQLMAKLDEEGVLQGKVRRILNNHFAMRYRERYKNTNQNEYLSSLESGYDDIEVSNFAVENETSAGKDLVENFDFLHEDACDILEDKIYLQPLQFFSKEQNPFLTEKREFPIDFGFPFEEKIRVVINLPQGYKVESLPQPVKMTLPEELGSFVYNISENNNTLLVSVTLHVKKAMLAPQYYDFIKEYYKQIITKETEKVVLTKV